MCSPQVTVTVTVTHTAIVLVTVVTVDAIRAADLHVKGTSGSARTMPTALPPNTYYYQLANFFFLLSAVFSDVVLIRSCLVLAYVLMLVQTATGWPSWPHAVGSDPSFVAADGLTWLGVILPLHVWAVARLVWDERMLKAFGEERDESLWAFWNHRTGVSRFDFVPILQSGKWVSVERGAQVDTSEFVFLVVKGLFKVRATGLRRRRYGGPAASSTATSGYEEERANGAAGPGVETASSSASMASPLAATATATLKKRLNAATTTTTSTASNNKPPSVPTNFEIMLGSGAVFDLQLLNVLKWDVGFVNDDFRAVAMCDSLCFAFPLAALQAVADGGTPLVRSVWRDFTAHALADVANREWSPTLDSTSSLRADTTTNGAGESERNASDEFLDEAVVFLHPHFVPEPEPGSATFCERFVGFWKWIWGSMNLSIPRGLRHNPVPVVGVRAAQSVMRVRRTSTSMAAAAAAPVAPPAVATTTAELIQV